MKYCRPVFFFLVVFIFLTSLAIAQDETSPDEPVKVEDEDELLDEFETLGPSSMDEKAEPMEGKFKTEEPEKEGLDGVHPGVYTIQNGDTLWGVCSGFLGNPYEWPKLWSINQYITNPHYIYPGGMIIFHPGSETTVPKMEIADEVSIPEDEDETAPAKKKKPVSVANKEPEVYMIKLKNLSFITRKELKEAGTIIHSGEAKRMLVAGDRAFLEFRKGKSPKIGDTFIVFDTVKKIRHPKGGKFLGYHILQKAKMKIVKIEKKAITAVITSSMADVRRDDRFIEYKSPVRKIVPKEHGKDISGYIVGSEPQHRMIGQAEFAFIDKGKAQGIQIGTTFYVVRRGDGILPTNEKRFPWVTVGKVIVVEPKEKTSTVYVIDSITELEIGDVIKTKL